MANVGEDGGSAADQETWDGDRAARWVRMADGLERQLAPVSGLLFDRARLEAGERVLDVGCGTGPTTRHAARLVGPSGLVVGVDISSEMIDAARRSDESTAGDAPIEWYVADVTAWRPMGAGGGAHFDVAISRFGVMFFADPSAAFANLAALVAPGGRLHVTVWADRADSPFDVPLTVALDTLRAAGIEHPAPPAPAWGPFSLADRARVVPMLEAAGWTDLSWDRHDVQLAVAGGVAPAEAAAGSIDLGPVRLVTAELDDAARSAVADAIAAEYEQHVHDGHVVLGGTVIVISGRSPR